MSASHIKSWSSQSLRSWTCQLTTSKIGIDVQLLKDSQVRAKTRSSWFKCAVRDMKLCSGSVEESNDWYLAVLSHVEAVIDVNGSVEGIDAFIY